MSLFNYTSLAKYLLSNSMHLKQGMYSIHNHSFRKIYPIIPYTVSINNLYQSNVNYHQSKADNLYQLLLASESMYRFLKTNHETPNLFQQLLNKYWQQTIFFSESTPSYTKYIYQQSKADSIITRSKRKKFLINLSKSLLSGRIDSQAFFHSNNHFSPYIQYAWRKGFNVSIPKKLPSFNLKTQKDHNYSLNKNEQALSSILQNNHFPLFVVVNGYNQMIIAEPAEELLTRRSLINMFYQWYCDHCLSGKNGSKIYDGWFFINPQDASEYKNYIQRQYFRSSKDHKLNIFSTSLDFYYRLSRLSISKIQFRLLPDLIEVSKLLTDNKHRKNLIFHPKQKYGKTFFQGQPIYLIQPVINFASKIDKFKKILYYYQLPDDPLSNKYNAIFLSKEDALIAWNKFRKEKPWLNLPNKPTLLVYNLEDFLKDREFNNNNNDLIGQDFVLVPGKDAYQEIQQSSKLVSQKTWLDFISDYFSSYLLLGKLWSVRIVSSLTTRQPPR
uniref:Uncharacterized protein n=1 Tax=Kumanoa americana TaxID=1196377 RepID=A0A1C9CGL4_9FLOR|nr:hypothetical protein Kuma_071 [Kumanoa americana]AOM67505.1 hypothetical protein Kuma_071 [Kumanoa americana]